MKKSRRLFLKQTGLASFFSFINPSFLFADDKLDNALISKSKLLNFDSIPTDTSDEISLPKGFNYSVVCAWGDGLFPHSPKFAYGENTSDAQALQIGENHDGMSFFPLVGTKQILKQDKNTKHSGILAINHEYNNYEYLFSMNSNSTNTKFKGKNYLEDWTAEKVKKAQMSLGVSIVGIEYNTNIKTKQNSNNNQHTWQVNVNSPYNKRYHLLTDMQFTGLAAGSRHLHNIYDDKKRRGHKTKGTFANCANGKTPWGTYLTCEENFSGYFTTDNQDYELSEIQKRYGVTKKGYDVNWHKFDDRFNIEKNPNEVNCFGWIVEIDPYNPQSIAKKHTALGRFKHENIAIKAIEGKQLVAYMGDDDKNEYIYKYISKGIYKEANGKKNSDLLTDGTLFVAKFSDEKYGEWIPLIYDERYLNNPKNLYIKSQVDIYIFTRYAADIVNPTDMDRPEWIAINPYTNYAYVSLTNNHSRKKINLANPRKRNDFGHILRWQDDFEHMTHAQHKFNWDIFLLAGNISQGGSQDKILFNSPDCITFDNKGRLWIATDGNISNANEFVGHGNNQLLCADTKTGEIKRFLVGVKGCEITGVCFDDVYKTLFLNIQHPGENFSYGLPTEIEQSKDDFTARNPLYISSWPRNSKVGENAKTPRSATIAIDISSL
ncbi:MAG: hypothetical protein RLZZ210_289 [Pseudomonadota bacterium]